MSDERRALLGSLRHGDLTISDSRTLTARGVWHVVASSQVKSIFVNSLQIAADPLEAGRRPLLNRDEFHEAVCRIAYRYDAAKDAETRSGAFSVGAPANRRAARKAEMRKAEARPVCATAVTDVASAHVSALKDKLEGASDVELQNELEAAILETLPLIGGKLLALLETS